MIQLSEDNFVIKLKAAADDLEPDLVVLKV
jgi:hypothetical protein